MKIVVEDEKNGKCGKDGSLSFTVDVMDTEAKCKVRGYFQPDVEDHGTEGYQTAPAYLLVLGHCRHFRKEGEQTLGIVILEAGEENGQPAFRRVGNFSGRCGLIGRNMKRLCWTGYSTSRRILLI